MNEEEIYRRAILKWGPELQLGMLMEECAELIQRTHKIMRESITESNVKDLAEEIADVEIMIAQTKIVIGRDINTLIKAKKQEKLEKLEILLEELESVKKELKATRKREVELSKLTTFEKDWESESDAIWDKL